MYRTKSSQSVVSSGLAWLLLAGVATGQTYIQPLPPAQPGPYGNAQPQYLPPPANQYPSISNNPQYSLPQPPDVGQSPYQQPGIPYSADTYPNSVAPASAPTGAPLPQAVGSGAANSLPAPQQSYEAISLPSGGGGEPITIEAIESEYNWYHYPWVWIPRDGWNSSIEFGLNGAEGNTNSLSYAAGADISRKSDLYNLTLNIDYRRTNANGLETQNNARGNLDLDRAIAESKLATFIKTGVEYDQFKAFDARVNVNGGLSYAFSKTDDFTFITRFGAGASQEIGSVDENWKPEALFGLESNHQVNSRNRVFAKIDYFPAFEDFSDYRLVTDAGWEILLDDSENFSLKLSATNRYDSTPLGLEPQDIDYAATLLYKF